MLGGDAEVAVMAEGEAGVALQLPARVGEVPAKEFVADAPGLAWLQSACWGSGDQAARSRFKSTLVTPEDGQVIAIADVVALSVAAQTGGARELPVLM